MNAATLHVSARMQCQAKGRAVGRGGPGGGSARGVLGGRRAAARPPGPLPHQGGRESVAHHQHDAIQALRGHLHLRGGNATGESGSKPAGAHHSSQCAHAHAGGRAGSAPPAAAATGARPPARCAPRAPAGRPPPGCRSCGWSGPAGPARSTTAAWAPLRRRRWAAGGGVRGEGMGEGGGAGALHRQAAPGATRRRFICSRPRHRCRPSACTNAPGQSPRNNSSAEKRTAVAGDQGVDPHLMNARRLLRKLGLGRKERTEQEQQAQRSSWRQQREQQAASSSSRQQAAAQQRGQRLVLGPRCPAGQPGAAAPPTEAPLPQPTCAARTTP